MTLNTQLLKAGSLALTVAISITACSKPAEEDSKIDSQSSEPANVSNNVSNNITNTSSDENALDNNADKATDIIKAGTETDKEVSTSYASVSDNNLLANMAVKTASMSLEGMNSAGVLNDKQSKCVKDIDLKSQVSVVQGLIDESFDIAEVKELSDFYSQPSVQAVTDFGREQMLVMMGLQVELKATQPAAADMKKVIGFAETAIGKKFTEFNMKEGENTMNGKLSGFIISELKKCGISPESDPKP